MGWLVPGQLTIASFLAYLCVYCVRVSPFVSGYSDVELLGLPAKVVFAMSQTIGYGLGKVPAVVYASNIDRPRWSTTSRRLLVCAYAPLLVFAAAPPLAQALCLFVSGLALSPIYGIVLRYLEGRKTAEVTMSLMSLSLVVGSGLVKTVGAALLPSVGDAWLPALVGGVGVVGHAAAMHWLASLPEPSVRDVELRKRRLPASKSEIAVFLRANAVGLLCVFITYGMTVAFRNCRDYFMPELFEELVGESSKPGQFTESETAVSVVYLLALGLMYRVKSHRIAFFSELALIVAGATVIAIATATLLHRSGSSGIAWMVCVGAGVFVMHAPPSSVLWDRLIGAMAGAELTTSFLIYLSDGAGYVCTLIVLLSFGLSHAKSHIRFFEALSYVLFATTLLLIGAAAVFFKRKLPPDSETEPLPSPVALVDVADPDEKDLHQRRALSEEEEALMDDDESM